MSILNVEHLSHGFGDRAIFHGCIVPAFKRRAYRPYRGQRRRKIHFYEYYYREALQPDEGKVEWAKNVRAGYLDQHTVLEKGMTIREVLKSAFSFLFEMEEQMNAICEQDGRGLGRGDERP